MMAAESLWALFALIVLSVGVGVGGTLLFLNYRCRAWFKAARFWRVKFEDLEREHLELKSQVLLLGHAAREILESGDEIVRNPRVRERIAATDAQRGNPFKP